jgi:hypothetical protein
MHGSDASNHSTKYQFRTRLIFLKESISGAIIPKARNDAPPAQAILLIPRSANARTPAIGQHTLVLVFGTADEMEMPL